MIEVQQNNGESFSEVVVLVDQDDQEIGTIEKIAAHKSGLMHRAVSVIIYNPEGKMLIQQRSMEKYHCGGMWSNACCSHPRPGESVQQAAERRLLEELGISLKLKKVFDFTYRAELGNGLIENEFDHVFYGEYMGDIKPDPKEVMNWRYVSNLEIDSAIQGLPGYFTPWFILLYLKLKELGLSGS